MADKNTSGTGLKNFIPAYDCLVAKYGPMTAVVYGYIWRCSQMERRRCDAKRATIKRLLHIDESTFTTHARKLASGGYVRFQERGNSSTIYWPTGLAETENASFSRENFLTKRDSSEEIFLTSGGNSNGSRENSTSEQGNFPYEESIKETTKERKEERVYKDKQRTFSICPNCGKPKAMNGDEVFSLFVDAMLEDHPGADENIAFEVANDMVGELEEWCKDCDVPKWLDNALGYFPHFLEGKRPIAAFPDEYGRVISYVG